MTDIVEMVARAISVPCGRCSGRGTERHQLDRDPAAGFGEHACPSCGGDGRSVFHRNVVEVAQRAVDAAGSDRLVELVSSIAARHTPTMIELEFFYTDGPSDFCTGDCTERTCEGHCEKVWCCNECGDVDDDGMSFSWTRWPCRTLLDIKVSAGDLVELPTVPADA